jgi:DNA (cytosine-5)-methyltransferase 1
MGKIRYIIIPRRKALAKQIHIRLDDRTYNTLSEYSVVTNRPVQDCVAEALIHLFEYRNTEKKKSNSKFTFIDLFAGIGGMRIAFEQNGGQCVFSSEWDRYCQRTYYDNFATLPHGDITKIETSEIPDHDVLVAGFPCQPFSIAGVSKKKSLGRATGFLDKTQGTLFFDVVRIIDAKRPKAFLLENVKNLKNHDGGNTWKVIMNSLEELDYEIFSAVLDGQDYTPQHRERVIIVGFDRGRYGESIPFEFNLVKPEKKKCIHDILQNDVDEKYTLSDHLWQYLQEYAKKHQERGNGFGFGLVSLTGITRTLSARYYKDGSEILIPQKGRNPRRLTPRECARLQGFFDDFQINVSDTQAYKQFGNSVVVPLISAVAKRMVETITNLESGECGEESVG